ncbi:hypothetical protein TNCV_4542541 [Trichonephila clavipes]|nr:hypothetical protein TNCV_4542541 [Trichonephila clavipes]
MCTKTRSRFSELINSAMVRRTLEECFFTTNPPRYKIVAGKRGGGQLRLIMNNVGSRLDTPRETTMPSDGVGTWTDLQRNWAFLLLVYRFLYVVSIFFAVGFTPWRFDQEISTVRTFSLVGLVSHWDDDVVVGWDTS